MASNSTDVDGKDGDKTPSYSTDRSPKNEPDNKGKVGAKKVTKKTEGKDGEKKAKDNRTNTKAKDGEKKSAGKGKSTAKNDKSAGTKAKPRSQSASASTEKKTETNAATKNAAGDVSKLTDQSTAKVPTVKVEGLPFKGKMAFRNVAKMQMKQEKVLEAEVINR